MYNLICCARGFAKEEKLNEPRETFMIAKDFPSRVSMNCSIVKRNENVERHLIPIKAPYKREFGRKFTSRDIKCVLSVPTILNMCAESMRK